MRSREWLVNKGLAKATRGRLSLEARQALADAVAQGMQFDDLSAEKIKENVPKLRTKVRAEAVAVAVRTRKETKIWAIDPAAKMGQTDLIIGFDTCAGCNRAISYCTHDTPKLPHWIEHSKVYFTKPNSA
jgi:hypothetical protein